MPISAAMFRSDHKNPVPQCPPRLDVQMLTPVIWSRMPNHFLAPETGRVSERLGWKVQCMEPLIMMALHIPEENRYSVNMKINSLIPKIFLCAVKMQSSFLTSPGALTSWNCQSAPT